MILHVRVALGLDLGGIRPGTARSHLAIAAVEAADHVHAGNHPAERRESLRIQSLVVAHVDEDLGGAGLRSVAGVSHGALPIAPLHGVVGDAHGRPQPRGLRVSVDPPLHHIVRQNPVEAVAVVVTAFDQLVEMIRPAGSQIPGHLHDKRALTGIESHAEDLRRMLGSGRLFRRGGRRRTPGRTPPQEQAGQTRQDRRLRL